MGELILDEKGTVGEKESPFSTRKFVMTGGVLASLLGSAFGYGESMQRIKSIEKDQSRFERYQVRANEIFDERLRNIERYSGVPAGKIRRSLRDEPLLGDGE